MNADASQPSKPATLIELVVAYRSALAFIDDNDGEITPEVDAQLSELASSMERKLEAYALLLRELEGEASQNAAFAEHYTRRKERKMRQREQLRERMAEALRAMATKKVATPTATVWLQKSGTPKLVVKDEKAAMDAGFVEHVYRLNRDWLRESIEKGDAYDFAELVTTESLRCK